MITFLKGSFKGNTPMFQSRQLVGMDLEIVHAKSNKPLVTIQDQVKAVEPPQMTLWVFSWESTRLES